MKTLYIDCAMGAAGDMLAAALVDATRDPEATVARLNAIGLHGVEYALERTSRCGLAACRLVVKVHGEEEGAAHGHGHAHHEHHAHHAHHTLDEILRMIDSLSMPAQAKDSAAAVYRLLADAESRAHGRPVGEVHFHEVGALDAVADIAAVSLLVAELGPDEIAASPVNVGGGTVRCAHGTVSVPAPATAILLEGVPSFGDDEIRAELCTPTGAALLRHFVGRFGAQPVMRIAATGHGAGKMDFEGRANLLRCTVGESSAGSASCDVLEFACTIDDMTGEDLAFAAERIMEAGALDVASVPAAMKKGRPGTLLLVLCEPSRGDAVADAIFRHTTTLGIRERECRRRTMARRVETVTLPDGSKVRVKTAEGFGTVRSKPEYDDLAAVAMRRNTSLAEVRADFFDILSHHSQR